MHSTAMAQNPGTVADDTVLMQSSSGSSQALAWAAALSEDGALQHTEGCNTRVTAAAPSVKDTAADSSSARVGRAGTAAGQHAAAAAAGPQVDPAGPEPATAERTKASPRKSVTEVELHPNQQDQRLSAGEGRKLGAQGSHQVLLRSKEGWPGRASDLPRVRWGCVDVHVWEVHGCFENQSALLDSICAFIVVHTCCCSVLEGQRYACITG